MKTAQNMDGKKILSHTLQRLCRLDHAADAPRNEVLMWDDVMLNKVKHL